MTHRRGFLIGSAAVVAGGTAGCIGGESSTNAGSQGSGGGSSTSAGSQGARSALENFLETADTGTLTNYTHSRSSFRPSGEQVERYTLKLVESDPSRETFVQNVENFLSEAAIDEIHNSAECRIFSVRSPDKVISPHYTLATENGEWKIISESIPNSTLPPVGNSSVG